VMRMESLCIHPWRAAENVYMGGILIFCIADWHLYTHFSLVIDISLSIAR